MRKRFGIKNSYCAYKDPQVASLKVEGGVCSPYPTGERQPSLPHVPEGPTGSWDPTILYSTTVLRDMYRQRNIFILKITFSKFTYVCIFKTGYSNVTQFYKISPKFYYYYNKYIQVSMVFLSTLWINISSYGPLTKPTHENDYTLFLTGCPLGLRTKILTPRTMGVQSS